MWGSTLANAALFALIFPSVSILFQILYSGLSSVPSI